MAFFNLDRFIADQAVRRRRAFGPFVHDPHQTFIGVILDVELLGRKLPDAEFTLDVGQAGLGADPEPILDARSLNEFLGREGLAGAHFRRPQLEVVGQAGIGQMLLVRHQRALILVLDQVAVEPGEHILAGH